MDSETNTRDCANHESATYTQSTASTTPPDPEQQAPISNGEQKQAENSSNSQKSDSLWRRFILWEHPQLAIAWFIARKPDFWIALLTFVIAAATVVNVWVAEKQWGEMNRAGRQTDKLIEQATRNATAATDASNAAKDSLTEYRNMSHLDQRAWISVPDVGLRNLANQVPSFHIPVRNGGKTPALEVSVLTGQEISPIAALPQIHFGGKPNLMGALSPSTEGSVEMYNTVGDFAQAAFEQRRRDAKKLAIFGTVTYKDVFGASHYTEFCYSALMFLEGNTVQFIECPVHHDSN